MNNFFAHEISFRTGLIRPASATIPWDDGATLGGSRYLGVLHQPQALSLTVKQDGNGLTTSAISMTSLPNLGEVTFTPVRGVVRKHQNNAAGRPRPSAFIAMSGRMA